MPLGNGEIGMNVWCEPDGDLAFYVSKADAWGGNIYSSWGLPKVGRVRIKLDPNPFASGAPFLQKLQLENGEIRIEAGTADKKVAFDVWVDANNPVIHIDGQSAQMERVQVVIDTYRAKPEHYLRADTVFQAHPDSIRWCGGGDNKTDAALVNRTFGALINGDGFVSAGDSTLQSQAAVNEFHVRLYPLTAQTPTPDAWNVLVEREAADDAPQERDLAGIRKRHDAWWRDFWSRSWVVASGDADAEAVTKAYALQRFIGACASRGDYPIKFNGSLFTTDYTVTRNKDGVKTTEDVNADYRAWGGQYWFQNTRPMYWPLLQSGDFDLMQPLFRMYRDKLPDAESQVKQFYGHGGAYFAETNPFWSQLPDIKPDAKPSWTLQYYTPILELCSMMLDYYDYTGDQTFIAKTLLSIADDGVAFFDQHFQKGADGKLDLTPDNAIETYWGASDPAPDIAGLKYVLSCLLALPSSITNATERSEWTRILSETPDLPMGTSVTGAQIILPFNGATSQSHRSNGENPELYAVYPFRLYGVGKPDLQVARDTFAARKSKGATCWLQDPVHAAYLGDAVLAKQDVVTNFSDSSRDPQERFPIFWGPFHDYTPDEDNGGNGMNALQLMVLQPVDRKLVLMPAWPADWSCRFKLHAPANTVIEGEIGSGKVVALSVTPKSRRSDVVLAQADGTLVQLP
jgi:hypothetical protein